MSFYDDEIDLRPYFSSIRRRWWQILLASFILGAAAFLVGIVQPNQFRATASILLTRTRATLALAEQFRTVNEPIDSRSRLDALISIAESESIALTTLDELRDQLPAEYLELDKFMELVRVTSKGDILQVTAEAEDPDLAFAIANTWARNAASLINFAYSEEQPISEVQFQLAAARSEYEAAQDELEAFIQDNRITLLENQIAEAQAMIASLADDRAGLIAYHDSRKLAMERLLVQASALEEQLSHPSQSSAGILGDSLAVLISRATAMGVFDVSAPASSITQPSSEETFIFESPSAPQIALDIRLSDLGAQAGDPQAMINDLEFIIEAAQLEKAAADQAIKDLTQELLSTGEIEELTLIDAQLRSFETGLEQESSRQLELTSTRDLTWRAYQALAEKEVEIRNSGNTQNLVTIASEAVRPNKPAPANTLRNSLIAAVVGLGLGALWSILAQTRQSEAGESQEPNRPPST